MLSRATRFPVASLLIAAICGSGVALAQTGEVVSQFRVAEGEAGFQGPAGQGFAGSMAALGDLDGDGVGDLAVGEDGEDAFWILFLRADGTVRGELRVADGQAGFQADPAVSNLGFGSALATLGDLDGDGTLELAVGARHGGLKGRGTVWILSLDSSGSVVHQVLITNGSGGLGTPLPVFSEFGAAVASIGDVDGDGIVDLAVGAPRPSAWGAVYVLLLNSDGTVRAWTKLSRSAGGVVAGTLQFLDRFGESLAGIGDRNGDAIPDLAVGVPGYRPMPPSGMQAGAVRVVYLAASGQSIGMQIFDEASTGTNFGDEGEFGVALASLGDLDGDGGSDLLVGQRSSPVGPPEAWCLFLRPDGTMRGVQRLMLRDFVQPAAGSALSVASLGDPDGDGLEDVVLGVVAEAAFYRAELDDSPFLPPVAHIEHDVLKYSPGAFLVAQFRDASENNVSRWEWDFSNRVVPFTEPDPQNTFLIPRNSTITLTLTVTGIGGQSVAKLRIPLSPPTSSLFVGSGTNPLCLGLKPAVLGLPLVADVDTSAFPTTSAALLMVYARPRGGVFIPSGEVLVDLASPRYLNLLQAGSSPGPIRFTTRAIPLDLAFIGRQAAAQGAVLDAQGLHLCNAVRLRVGF
ncbi:MAG TPA: hypothetical protein ENJ09_16335 [Planctomycetes bacterium]|nr:hypothetical protein [Planctomycetota bacterium]